MDRLGRTFLFGDLQWKNVSTLADGATQMAATLANWEFGVVRGPGWLIVKPIPHGQDPTQSYELAEAVWGLLQQHFVQRLVIEMDQVSFMSSYLIGQLVLLQKRIHQQGGVLRVCGMSPDCQQAMQLSQLHKLLPNYVDREQAILGARPTQPR